KSKSNSIDINDVKTMSYWVQDQLFVGENLVVLAGLRLDDHDEFGSKTTYRVAPSYSIEQTGTILKASYGTGFRSPSLYELYSSYGNPNLNAEKSKGWDSGFEQKIANNKINFGATYFNMVYNNRIDFDLATWKYDQVSGDTKTDGVEAFIGWKPVAGLKFLLNYTYTDTQDPDGKRLVRRPFNKFLFNTGYCFLEKWKINLDIYWVDDRKASEYAKDGAGNLVDTLDSYTLVNVSASYDINDHFQVYGRVDNLFDEYYEEAWSYAKPGLSGYAGVKVRF
ncbi:MAG: TonB-dependent receptor, partial [Desulfobacterium sp.]|nr:TonB-dependent receptor [Desulfobacterium sp.]MBU4036729.1 TonB-dependent receptor [Pseudomonadota bacterium]